MPEPAEPCARRTLFSASRAAVLDLWGHDGLASVAALVPEEVRRETIDAPLIAAEWIPERYMLCWYEAIRSGPAQRDTEQLRAFIRKRMSHGFGRVRKLLLKFASPAQLLEKAPALWRHDHSTGTLAGTLVQREATVTLRDHPYNESPLGRMATAEVYRHALSLLRGTRDVVEHHGVDAEGALVVRLAWK